MLHYRINYPEFSSEKYPRSTKSISNYYSRIARQFQRFIETEIYRMAVEEYRNAVENGYPVRVFDVVQSYEVTYNVSCIISLYFDRTFTREHTGHRAHIAYLGLEETGKSPSRSSLSAIQI